MIVVSKERYLPVTINTLVLFKDDQYFYVHRDVYDQAVVLSDRYNSIEELKELIGGSNVNDDIVSWFFEKAPHPIHTLAPYLSLVEGELEQDMELCCGVLHTITTMINVRSFILKSSEVRKSVSFSLSIKEEYEMAWDRFFMSAIPYDQQHNVVHATHKLAERRQDHAVALTGNTNAVMTSTLDGFSIAREEVDVYAPLTSTESEREATRKLLNLDSGDRDE